MWKIMRLTTVWLVIGLLFSSGVIKAAEEELAVPSEGSSPQEDVIVPIEQEQDVFVPDIKQDEVLPYSPKKAEDVELNRNQPYSISYESENDRITKQTNIYLDGYQEIISYSYDDDGSVDSTTNIIPPDGQQIPDIPMDIQSEPEDKYIYDSTIRGKLNALSLAWGMAEGDYSAGRISLAQKEAIQEKLHNEGEQHRVDYIVINPFSEYAKLKLGGSNRNYPLSRQLRYDSTNTMTGMDVMVIQRALELYEYIDPLEDQDFGNYGVSTKEAVEDFQRKVMGNNNPDGIVGPQTYSALFSGSTKNVRTSYSISQLAIARNKHNLVVDYSQQQIIKNSISGTCKLPLGGVCKEVYIPGGGRKGGRGFADILDVSRKMVWEVKPNTKSWVELGGNKGAKQLERYINASQKTVTPYFPLTSGVPIKSYRFSWSSTEEISVRPGVAIGNYAHLQGGMIYYDTVKKKQTPVTNPTPAPAVQKQKQTNPSPSTLSLSAKIFAGVVVTYKVGKFIVSVVMVPGTGGTSLFLNLTP